MLHCIGGTGGVRAARAAVHQRRWRMMSNVGGKASAALAASEQHMLHCLGGTGGVRAALAALYQRHWRRMNNIGGTASAALAAFEQHRPQPFQSRKGKPRPCSGADISYRCIDGNDVE